jgi:triacylglycerol lipase
MVLRTNFSSLTGRTRRWASRLRLMAQVLADPDDLEATSVPASPARRPIVLLHGFGSSKRMLRPLQSHLRRTTGRVVVSVSISSGREDLRESARRVQAVVEQLARSPEFEYADVVGHSMGGLVATYLLKRIDCGARVRNVVTLGTPHRGAPMAFVGVVVMGLFCEAIWQLLPGSSLVRELKWTPVPEGCELISIAGAEDMLVPESFTQLTPLPGHRNIRCNRADHLQLLFSRPAMRELRSAVRAATNREAMVNEGAAA